jgi:hypothetical protein
MGLCVAALVMVTTSAIRDLHRDTVLTDATDITTALDLGVIELWILPTAAIHAAILAITLWKMGKRSHE